MKVTVSISSGPLAAKAVRPQAGSGATLLFEGVIRPAEGDQPISGIEYEAYRPMADQLLEQLACTMAKKHHLSEIAVEHSEGFVPIGQVSFRLVIHSAHRKEALAAMGEFIDLMKQDIPIWKHPRAETAHHQPNPPELHTAPTTCTPSSQS